MIVHKLTIAVVHAGDDTPHSPPSIRIEPIPMTLRADTTFSPTASSRWWKRRRGSTDRANDVTP